MADAGRTPRGPLLVAAALGASGVILGAFGTHALRARLPADLLEVYRTGVLYQLLHAVAALAVAARAGGDNRLRGAWLTVILMAVGVVIFSGSLYLLAITGVRRWGAVTPFGGAALIAAWVSIFVCALRPIRPR